MRYSKFKLGTFFLLSVIFLLVGALSITFWKEIDYVTKLGKTIARRQKNETLIIEQVTATLADLMKTVGKDLILYPQKLSRVICSQQLGIVTDVKKVELDSIFAPYNASILEKDGGGYHLFFRYDELRNPWNATSFFSHIGYAELDVNFSVVQIIDKINTGSSFSEDPRIVKVGSSFYLSWNDALDKGEYARSIHIGEWDPHNYKMKYVTNLQQYIAPVEKNWVPFEVKGENQKPTLAFVYGIYPHKIIGLENPKYNRISHHQYDGYNALHDLKWTNLWGIPRGGTTARLVGDEYISFFHSSFKEGAKTWYVMGAYTFESKPPYKITAITPYPILFPGIYTSQILNTADPSKYCIFPAGIAIEKKEGKTFLHVSCGENDSCSKIVTIDYNRLRNKMVPVK